MTLFCSARKCNQRSKEEPGPTPGDLLPTLRYSLYHPLPRQDFTLSMSAARSDLQVTKNHGQIKKRNSRNWFFTWWRVARSAPWTMICSLNYEQSRPSECFIDTHCINIFSPAMLVAKGDSNWAKQLHACQTLGGGMPKRATSFWVSLAVSGFALISAFAWNIPKEDVSSPMICVQVKVESFN